jgi:hypothetical protein
LVARQTWPVSIDVDDWAVGLVEPAVRIGRRFGRVEPLRQALAYARGLLAGLERNNRWTLAD